MKIKKFKKAAPRPIIKETISAEKVEKLSQQFEVKAEQEKKITKKKTWEERKKTGKKKVLFKKNIPAAIGDNKLSSLSQQFERKEIVSKRKKRKKKNVPINIRNRMTTVDKVNTKSVANKNASLNKSTTVNKATGIKKLAGKIQKVNTLSASKKQAIVAQAKGIINKSVKVRKATNKVVKPVIKIRDNKPLGDRDYKKNVVAKAKDKPVVICCLAKNEHLYINDWVRYHLELGFDHIYIFDNDDFNAEFIDNYIDAKYQDKVTIFDIRGEHRQWLQSDYYNTFYHEFISDFSWCAFIDVDEFIVLNKWNNIKEMVNDERFKGFNSIRLGWRIYGDDDAVERDMSVPVYKFFKKRKMTRKKKEGKQITAGGVLEAKIENHAYVVNGRIGNQCTVNGVRSTTKNEAVDINGNFEFDDAYINHYQTKTLSEFLRQKYHRGDAMFEKNKIDLRYFWEINKKTLEKIEYLKKLGINE